MRFIISCLILLGLSFPYIIQFIVYDYHKFVILVLKNILSGNLSSISSLMAFSAIIAYAFRIKQGPGSLQDSLIITTVTMPVVFPSLIMIGIIISQSGQISSEYFRAASDLYLIGIASLVIAIPFIGIINQWYNGLNSRGSPFSQIIATMIIFSIINFVFISANFSEEITLTSEQLKIQGINIILDGIFALQLILNNILQTGSPVIPQNIIDFVKNPIDTIMGWFATEKEASLKADATSIKSKIFKASSPMLPDRKILIETINIMIRVNTSVAMTRILNKLCLKMA